MFSFKDVPFYNIAKPTVNSLRRIMIYSPDEIDISLDEITVIHLTDKQAKIMKKIIRTNSSIYH